MIEGEKEYNSAEIGSKYLTCTFVSDDQNILSFGKNQPNHISPYQNIPNTNSQHYQTSPFEENV